MPRSTFLAAMMFAIPVLAGPAAADPACDVALREVHATASASGPFRKSTIFRVTGKSGEIQSNITVDAVLPNRLHRISILENGKVGDMLIIDGQVWEGTVGAPRKSSAAGAALIKGMFESLPFWINAAAGLACAMESAKDGHQIASFSWTTVSGETTFIENVTADARSKLPLTATHVTMTNGKMTIRSEDVFHFSANIKIEPPAAAP